MHGVDWNTQDQWWWNKADLRSKYSNVKAKAEEQDEVPATGSAHCRVCCYSARGPNQAKRVRVVYWS
jgi:hypothetical protein